MIAMDGFFFTGAGGPGQSQFIGTSLVAPLYAGLIAVVNAFFGRSVGFLNPTLYTYGPAICNDVRFGNNDAGNGPLPPDALSTFPVPAGIPARAGEVSTDSGSGQRLRPRRSL